MTKKTAPKKPAAAELKHIAEPIRGLAEPIESLEIDPRNARKHDARNLAAIRASLKEFGQVSAVVVNAKNGQVVIGNGRLLAAQELGWKYLAVVRRAYTPAQQRALSIADNRTAELATWDDELLEEILAGVKEDTPDLYNLLALEELELEAEEEEEEDTSPQLSEMEYRVIIDCKDEDEQLRLMERFEKENLQCRALIS